MRPVIRRHYNTNVYMLAGAVQLIFLFSFLENLYNLYLKEYHALSRKIGEEIGGLLS